VSGPFVVAVDGPVASGKSAVSVKLAKRLDALMLDTGAFYRALTWLALRLGVVPSDGEALAALVPRLSVAIEPAACGRGRTARMLVDGRDVTDELLTPAIDAAVSPVARERRVRDALLEPQRRAVRGGRAVVAGRDIGTVIFPDAAVKVYLLASPDERARRRAGQRGRGSPEAVAAALDALLARDRADAGQMVPAADAVMIDTDCLTLEAVVDRVEQLVKTRMGERCADGD
jgi:cytidylate kinase